MASLASVVDRLCEASKRPAVDQAASLVWPDTIDEEEWCMSPELISLHGTEAFTGLNLRQQKRLSFFEAVNFFGLNLHGERWLVQGLSSYLYNDDRYGVSTYLHHFLEEENRHMAYFGGFCMRYAGKVYAERRLALPRAYDKGEEAFLFFARVLAFEEIVDGYNVMIAKDGRVSDIVRQINRSHHLDESRHLAFGRRYVRELFEAHVPQWSAGVLGRVREELAGYIVSLWRDFYSSAAYADAGLAHGPRLRATALAAPACRAHRRRMSRRCLQTFQSVGILEREPSL